MLIALQDLLTPWIITSMYFDILKAQNLSEMTENWQI